MLIWAGVFVQCDSYCTNKSLKIAFGLTFFCLRHLKLLMVWNHCLGILIFLLKWQCRTFSLDSLSTNKALKVLWILFLICAMDEMNSCSVFAVLTSVLFDWKKCATNRLDQESELIQVGNLIANRVCFWLLFCYTNLFNMCNIKVMV